MNSTILINGMDAIVSPLTSYTTDACTSHNPIWTAKSLLVSTAICVGAALLIYSIYSIVIYVRHRYRDPYDHFYDELFRLMVDIKALVDLGNRTNDLFPDAVYGYGYDTKAHILWSFRHIDKIYKNGQLPPIEELEGEGARNWPPLLFDVIDGEKSGELKLVAVPSSRGVDRSRVTGWMIL